MRIAIINDLLGGGSNGTFVVTYNLLDHLKAQGHEVRVICPDQSKKGDPDYFVVPERNLGVPLNRYVKKVGVSISKCTRKLMEKALEGAQYIHCITPFRLARYAADIAREKNIPISAGFHIMAENITAYLHLDKLTALNTHIYKQMYKTLYRKVDCIHYPTGFIKAHFEYRVKKNMPAYVISNGADRRFKKEEVARPSKFDGKYIITSTGRYSREKSQETLLKAVADSRYKDDIQVVLVGHGARERYYKRLGKNLPNPPIMRVFSRDEMVKILNCTDLYVHPAYIELEGIACLEAMKCGVPTLVSDSPYSATYDFAADDECIFEDRDARLLARKIDSLLADAAERERIGKKSLASEVKYVDECMTQMDAMIAAVLRKKREQAEA